MAKNEVTIHIHRPNINELMFFLLSGAILSVPLTLFISQYAGTLLGIFPAFTATLISVAVFAPFIEEFSKIFPLFYRHGETQRSIFHLALMVGLGFGIVEYVTYVTLGVNPIIRIPGLIFHPASTAITAYGVAIKKPVPFYLAAVLLHLSNNAFAVLMPGLPITFLVLLIAVYAAWKLYKKTEEKFID
jgi:RsiW-degrading membrane proteinase PrsW (M82 family)